MLYIITLIMIIINMIARESKLVYYLDFVFLFILLGLSYGSYDTMIFINRYTEPQKFSAFTEILFNFIIKFFHALKFNYRQFMIVISIIELVMLFKFIKKNTKNVCYVISMFMIFPMINTFEQLRFFMGFILILTIGIDSLLTQEKQSLLKYTITVFIATLIHSSCLFFIIFIFANKFELKTVIKMVVAAIVFLITIGITPEMLKIIRLVTGSSKLEIVTRIQKGQEGQFGCACLSTLVFLEYVLFYIFIRNKTNELKIKEIDLKQIDLVLKMNVLSLVAIPLIYIFSVAFMRIATFTLLLNYIAIAKSLDYDKKYCISKYKLYITLGTTVCAVVLFFFASHTQTAFDLNVKPFFEENVLVTTMNANFRS